MSELQKNQEIKRQPETEKSNFLEIKKQLAALLAAIWIWVSGAVDNVGKVIIPSAYGAEVKKEIREDLKNIKVVEVKNMNDFLMYIVDNLDDTSNVAIIKIKADQFNQQFFNENIKVMLIKIQKEREKDGYKYFLISGRKYKETNRWYKVMMTKLDEESKKLDEESKKLDEESKKLDVQIAYYRFEVEMRRLIVFLNYWENIDILRKYNWKFSRKKLEQINKDLDKISVLEVDEVTFKQWIEILKQLEKKYPNMKDLIEEIIKKLKSKKRISPSMYAYSKK